MAYKTSGSYYGQEYDRWVGRNSNNSALGKVQKQFWFTKSAVLRKFGRKEDQHIVASDAELDAKIDLFNAIDKTTKELRGIIADYQTRICLLAQEENSLGKLLRDYGKQDQTKAGKMMVVIGKSLNSTAQHRVGMRSPLVRLYQEVDTFHLRAVEDTHRTVEEMEKVRTEYRGALMWMKNISQDFNPDQYQQLERFREVQAIVKRKKGKFEQLKIKCLQKIDLLAASRCNMFSHALILYQNNLITFSEKTAKTLTDISSNFKVYEPYKFQVIKELSDPLDDEQNNSDHPDQSVCKSTKSDTAQDTEEEEAKSLICLFDQPDNSLEKPADDLYKDFSNVDLLSESMIASESANTQELLKELFDSPVHSYEKVHSLPIFGCSNIKETIPMLKHNNKAGTETTQFFLPSQLIDFGFSEAESPKISNLTTSDSVSKTTTSTKNFAVGSKLNQPIQKEVTHGNKNFLQKNKDTSKFDWYKVFQEIDPLTDAGSSLFLKGYDHKQV